MKSKLQSNNILHRFGELLSTAFRALIEPRGEEQIQRALIHRCTKQSSTSRSSLRSSRLPQTQEVAAFFFFFPTRLPESKVATESVDEL